MGAIIRDPKDSRKLARVGSPADGTTVGDGLSTHSINWLTEPVSNIQRLARGTASGAAIVASDDRVLEITFTTPAEAVDLGDVLADTQEIPNAFTVPGGTAVVESITILDKDDQGILGTMIFLRRNVSVGTEDAAPSITDANAAEVLGLVPIAATDYIDLTGCKIATLKNIGLSLQAAPESTSLYVALLTGGTPTHTANGLSAKIGLLRN